MHSAAEPVRVTVLERAACRTYRSLRLAIVGLVVLIAVALALVTGQCSGLPGAISDLYYTPGRSVFVGALVAIGAALVAIRGRAGGEDVLLNLAGMTAVLIAVVPAAAPRVVGTRCAVLPWDPAAGVRTSLVSLLVVGLAGLVAAGIGVARRGGRGRPTLAAAAALWSATALWFSLAPASFRGGAHYAAAAVLFVLLTAVAVINALRAYEQPRPPLLPAVLYRGLYWFVAAVMVIVLAMAGVLGLVGAAGLDVAGSWMLPVETALLGAFLLFWLAQTAQFWHSGVPGRTRAAR